ncbi:TetR/AcrR family transcriptional regulator [Actinoplanes teichomyceticus]|uniref:TetR family transcriptional regulator n=1 Tax=Actinoplanes teichomyceticus TaxID=1867 RepID=A0A561WIZ0_ACTTI|nr:TetR/AcrR family transcriptional regulator [Actinoplanes teichomyceticus]TWG23835.1 TetR family transcriptional regulator [Actinoplanes teichomyceticus]
MLTLPDLPPGGAASASAPSPRPEGPATPLAAPADTPDSASRPEQPATPLATPNPASRPEQPATPLATPADTPDPASRPEQPATPLATPADTPDPASRPEQPATPLTTPTDTPDPASRPERPEAPAPGGAPWADGPPLRADAQRNRARILDAAEAVFAESGAGASTQEVARRAGVAIGTVFRHFPTKNDLLAAIMKRLLARLVAEAGQLGGGDGLFDFFRRLVAQAAGKRSVVDLLARAGVDVRLPDAVGHLEQAVGGLLAQAQAAGTVTTEVRLAEVMALLVSMCQGALHGGWDETLQDRALAVIFTGLRPHRA